MNWLFFNPFRHPGEKTQLVNQRWQAPQQCSCGGSKCCSAAVFKMDPGILVKLQAGVLSIDIQMLCFYFCIEVKVHKWLMAYNRKCKIVFLCMCISFLLIHSTIEQYIWHVMGFGVVHYVPSNIVFVLNCSLLQSYCFI